jgi:hypothetical protein
LLIAILPVCDRSIEALMNPELTICSVSYKSRPYLESNWRITQALNPNIDYEWLLCENSPPEETYCFSVSDLRFQVEMGPMPQDHGKATGSYHHAAGLNQLLQKVNTRFLLVLDPDFYIIRPNWIADTLNYMQDKSLSFFGAPWYPGYVSKYRYFPCVHCMFIDLDRIEKSMLDFNPCIEEQKKQKAIPGLILPETEKQIPFYFWPLMKLLSKGDEARENILFKKRRFIGTSLDTGYRIYGRFHNAPEHKQECLIPAFYPKIDSRYLKRKTARRLNRLMPEHLSYIPKKRASYTKTHFRSVFFPDLARLGWDEFFWQEVPFGFHIRNTLKERFANSGPSEQMELLATILPDLLPSLPIQGVLEEGTLVG